MSTLLEKAMQSIEADKNWIKFFKENGCQSIAEKTYHRIMGKIEMLYILGIINLDEYRKLNDKYINEIDCE